MTGRVILNVPYAEKDAAKRLGARWDSARRHWYVPDGLALQEFSRWLPSQTSLIADLPQDQTLPSAAGNTAQPKQGLSLTQLMQQVAGVVQAAFSQHLWVAAEITELQQRQGHWYLTLAESQDGQQIAQVKATLWAGRATQVQANFVQTTGDWITTGQKVLLLCALNVHPRFGLSLVIQDIDPSYTIGEQARKLQMIRQTLQAQGLYQRNRQHPLPRVWSRVAVLSPAQAAGLGDFRRDADALAQRHLCQFVYFHASFQGVQVVAEMQLALNQVLASHQQQAFDALVIIRGGGSQQDLMFLNELSIAQLVANLPLPVLTGIGHERDSTILDEIAHLACDTPSKVIAFIRDQIVQQTRAAITAWQTIQHLAQRQIQQHQRQLQQHRQSLIWSAQRQIQHQQQVLSQHRNRLADMSQRQLKQQQMLLQHHAQLIRANDPRRLLAQGYVLATSITDNSLIRSLQQAKAAGRIKLTFSDASTIVSVISVN